MKIALSAVWLVVGAIVVGYPLLADRMRVGGAGSEPVARADDPRAFWQAYALSTGIFLVVSAVAAFVLARAVP